jgi:putative two-component system response regulator
MQLHAAEGGECIREIEQRLGDSNFLQMARDIALYHHERWDSSGYPKGLQGDEIPLSARIVAVADVYDALATRRVYKEPYPHEECVTTIREAAATQFDPRIVDVFLTVEHEFRAIAQQFSESDRPVFCDEFDSGGACSTTSEDGRMTRDQERVLTSVLETEDCGLVATQGL